MKIFLCNKNNYIFIIFIFFFKNIFKNLINIPLSNTIFLFHPILLILGWCLIIFLSISFSIKSINIFNFYILLFSLVMGGYWSIQEFNWGGWWNWDVLELFSFLTVLNYIVFFHFFKKNTNIFFNKITWFLLNILITYFIFNKLGLTSSIHSFIKSSSYKNNVFYNYFILSIYFIYFFKKFFFILIIFSMMSIFLNYQVIIILKLIFFFKICIYFFFKKKKFKKKLNNLVHFLIKVFTILIIYYNYFNNSFLFYNQLQFNSTNIFINYKFIVFKTQNFFLKNIYIFTKSFFFKTFNVNFFNIWFFCVKNFFLKTFNSFIFLKFF